MANSANSSSITYEEIMGLVGRGSSAAGNPSDAESKAIQALSNRLITFRKWLTDDAKVIVHPSICIVNGEATDGTKNAPVMIVSKPTNSIGAMSSSHNNISTNMNGGVGVKTINNAATNHGPSSMSMLSARNDKSSSVIDNTAFNGRIGTVDGEGDISLYDRTMGCCVRVVRELKSNEVVITMPRSAMITPDLVASSDAGRAILACCMINRNVIESSTSTAGTSSSTNTAASSSTSLPGFWDAFENTTICESKFSPKITRTTGPQVLVRILQERKKAEQAYKKSLQVLVSNRTSTGSNQDSTNSTDNNTNNNMSLSVTRNDEDEEKQYKLAEFGTISTRAPFLAFLIHQRFSNSVRPLVVAKSHLSLYDDDDDNDELDEENEFQAARDSDDGNALSVIDTHGGIMTEVPYGSPDTFGPYARTLPSSVSLPLCWKRSELALLANCIPGVPLLQEVATMTSQLAAEFIAILEAGITTRFPKTFPEGLLTWDRWVWAAAVFSSRNLPASCYLNAGDEKAINFRPSHKMEFQSPAHIWDELGVIVPLLDMLNHEIDEHQVTWQPCVPERDIVANNNGKNGGGSVSNGNSTHEGEPEPHPPRAIVHKKVKKGSELYCCYGHLSTSNLILQYGFAQMNSDYDEVRMGWALQDAVGDVNPPNDYTPSFEMDNDSESKHFVFESSDEKAISSWWTDDRISLLEQEAFAAADPSFMTNLRAGKKMTVSATSDGMFHPILLAATVVATMPKSHVKKFTTNIEDHKQERMKVVIDKRHQRIIQRYLQFSFTRKLEKLLQNLDNGLKDHFGKIQLWTKSTMGGVRYDGSGSANTSHTNDSHGGTGSANNTNGNYIGWQTFFDTHAYKATMEVEKKYYTMGSDSCVLALYDGQLRALQLSVDNVSDDTKFANGVIQQLRDLGFEFTDEEIGVDDESNVKSDHSSSTGNVDMSIVINEEDEMVADEPNHDNNNENDDGAPLTEAIAPNTAKGLSSSTTTADGTITATEGGKASSSTTTENGKKPAGAANGGTTKSPRSRRRNRKKSSSSNNNNNHNNNNSATTAGNSNNNNNLAGGNKPPAVKLHIGNLSYATTPSNLYDYFKSIYGQDNVLECHIPVERDTGKSRGFGFVAMPEAVAKRALHSRHRHEVDGRVLKIAKSSSAGTGSTSTSNNSSNNNNNNNNNNNKGQQQLQHDQTYPPAMPLAPSQSNGRCATCGYRPKYCTCTGPPNNNFGFNNHRFPPPNSNSMGGGGPRGPPLMPPPPIHPTLLGPHPPMPMPMDYGGSGRDLSREYGFYRGPPPPPPPPPPPLGIDRHHPMDPHVRPMYDPGDDRGYRDRRGGYEYRYEDDFYRGGGGGGAYDRDSEYYGKDGRRSRDRGRDRSRSSRSRSRSSSTSRRRDADEGGGRGSGSSSRRGKKQHHHDEDHENDDGGGEHGRSSSKRALETRNKERNSKKKKSKRRGRSRSRSTSPA